jgi:3-oxoadipate enol-lactonase
MSTSTDGFATRDDAGAAWVPDLPPGRALELPGRGRVFVRDVAGPPGAPVLFLLHGWTATADLNWFPAFEPLSAHFRVVAFDHRGHGRGIRSRRRFRLTDCADDVVAAADALGIDRFVPVGYSMGGPVASLVWRRHPERVQGLVLCATASRFATTRRARTQLAVLGLMAGTSRVLPSRCTRPLFDRLVASRANGLQPWVVAEIRSADARQVLEAGADLRRFDSRAWISELRIPTSIVVVDGDEVVPTPDQDALARAIPDARVWRIDGGHDVCVRHPRRFTRALVAACNAVAGNAVAGAGRARP